MGGRTSAPEDRIKTVYLAVNGRDVSVSQQCSVVARSVCLRSLLSRPPSEEHFYCVYALFFCSQPHRKLHI